MTVDPALLLAQLCGLLEQETPSPSTVFVLAHPDDEAVGASVLVNRVPGATFVYVTNGSSRDLHDANAAGFSSMAGYARARLREVKHALSLSPLPRAGVYFLDEVDQEAALHLSSIARDVRNLLASLQPEVVITHPYEGGHPDHDSTAFAVHSACRLLAKEGANVPLIAEMTSYHNRGGSFGFGEFLDDPGHPSLDLYLDDEQREFKRQLLSCYPTQHRVLRSARLDVERYRIAPAYDFRAAPHSGLLLYEVMSWNMTGARWRRLAQAATEELGLHTPLAAAEPCRVCPEMP